MKKILILIATLISTSCSASTLRIVPNKRGIDPTFEPYIENYKYIIGDNQYDKRFENLSMNFADLGGSTIGVCYWLIGGGTEIEIDREYWDNFWTGQIGKEFLAYHELEHCIRYRMHSHKKEKDDKGFVDYFEDFMRWLGVLDQKGYFSDGCPNSIMHPYDVGYTCRHKHYWKYVQELRDWKD